MGHGPKNDKDGETEHAVIIRAKRGDEDAFQWLLSRYGAAIYDYCRRTVRGEDSRDIAHETFVKAFLSVGKFDETKRFAPWLFRIAHNLVIDYLRKKRLPTVPLSFEEEGVSYDLEVADYSSAPDELFSRKEVIEAFATALDGLEPEYKEVLILRYREGLSYVEISEALGLPLGTVKVRIHRGRNKMKQILLRYV